MQEKTKKAFTRARKKASEFTGSDAGKVVISSAVGAVVAGATAALISFLSNRKKGKEKEDDRG